MPGDIKPWHPEDTYSVFLHPKYRATFVVQWSEDCTEQKAFTHHVVSLRDCGEIKQWFMTRGYPVMLWTPPLPIEEAETYLAVLMGHTRENQCYQEGRVDLNLWQLLVEWGWETGYGPPTRRRMWL